MANGNVTYNWTDNPMVEDISLCLPNVVNEDLMYLKDKSDTSTSDIANLQNLIDTNTRDIASISSLIPLQASEDNQLADKEFVNSSIATNTADFIGTFESLQELEEYSGILTNNDYAFVIEEDSLGNTLYARYKYNATLEEWLFEYELNNSSFTATQWSAINSGINSGMVNAINNYGNVVNYDLDSALSNSSDNPVQNKVIYSALNGKQATLVSGTSIKTINNNSVLGSGNISVQPVLESGINIKSFNNYSILGSGNLNVQEFTILENETTFTNISGEVLNLEFVDYDTYPLINGETGLIYDARLSSNIARTSQIPHISNSYNALSSDGMSGIAVASALANSGFISEVTSSMVTTALGYTPYDGTTNPNNYVSSSLLSQVAYTGAYGDLINRPFIPTTLGSLTDVDITSPLNKQYLMYNSSSGIWVNSTIQWGDFGGTLGNQTDLQNALNGKQATLVSGTNIKTINNTSILGSGNIDTDNVFIAEYGETSYSDISTAISSGKTVLVKKEDLGDIIYLSLIFFDDSNSEYYFSIVNSQISITVSINSNDEWSYTDIDLQEKLVSGTNIKTVNGTSILGSGNISVGTVKSVNNTSPDASGNITISIPTVNDSTITFQKNGTAFDTITLNQSSNKSINILIPTDTGDLTNEAGYIKGISSSDVITALGYTPYNSTNPNNYISGIDDTDVITALGYTPYNATNPNGYISGITSSMVTTALGYTPYNSTNPNNYISSASISTLTDVAITSLSNGQALLYDYTSGKWKNSTIITSVSWGEIIGNLGDQLDLQNTLNTKQPLITSSAMLSSDLVDDTNKTHKFATSAQLSQIATNTNDISTINGLIPEQATTQNQLADKAFVNSSIATNTATFIGTFNSVQDLEDYSGTLTKNDYAFVVGSDSLGNTYYDRYKWNGTEWLFEYELNNSSFTATQWASINSGITAQDVALISTALQPNDDISFLNNDVGYITGITSTMVTTALGYTPYNGSTNPNGYITSSALSGYATETWVGNQGYATETWVGNQGYITGIDSTDVTTALGYTPYNGSTNPSGFLTSSDLANYVTTNTAQDITETKTFVGTKRVAFKQSGSSDKLGFTLYTNSGTEKGYLEYNPSNTVDSVPLLTLGNYASASGGLTHVGFRKYSSISGASGAYNLLAPLISDARTPFNLTTTYTNFYLPLGVTDGTTTVTTAKTGLLDISSLLSNFLISSDLSGYATETWVGNQGYITGITSSMVTTALGYTPYDSSNPNGYTSNTGTVTSVNSTSPDANGNVSLTIPTVGNGIITINQGGTQKGTFTVNQTGNTTINLDGSGSSTLAELSDVELTSLSNGQSLIYNSTSSKWENSSNNIPFYVTYNSTTYNEISEAVSQNRSVILSYGRYRVPLNYIGGQGSFGFHYWEDNTPKDIWVNTDDAWTIATGYAYQRVANLVTSISASSTDTQYPSAKCVYDSLPTESTVSGWGFTKNIGTVVKVNNISPDNNGNVTLSIPIVTDTYSATSSNGMSGIAVASALSNSGFITGISSLDVITALGYTPYNGATNPNGYVTTDTKNTTGSSDTSSKIFLVGATSQATSATTYSHDTVFVDTNGRLNSAAPASNANDTTVATTKWVKDQGYTSVDQTFDGTSTNAQSGVAINGELTTNYQSKLVSGTSIKTINNTNLLGSGDISVLQNMATGTNSLSLLGIASSKNYTVNIGYNSQTGNNNATAIGYSANASAGSATAIGKEATASGLLSTAIGTNATASNSYAIQLGYGTNSTASTLAVGFNGTNYQLLDGTTGLIPDARISNNIVKTVNNTAPDANGNVNVIVSGGANTDLSNLTTTGEAKFDAKVNKSGDTMTGNLTILGDGYMTGLKLKSTNYDITVTPTENKYSPYVNFLDQNGVWCGGVYIRKDTNGNNRLVLGVNNSSGAGANIVLQLNDNGTSTAGCPTPSASSDTNNIATTEWVNDRVCYRANDTYTNEQTVASYLTSSKTKIYFTIQVPKFLWYINTISVTKMLLHFRIPTGGYLVSDGWDAKAHATISVSNEGRYINVTVTHNTAFNSYTNNIPLCGYVEFGFKFT